MGDDFDHASRALRSLLAPVVDRVVARHRGAAPPLDEPRAARAVWFTLHDGHGAPLVLVSAHAESVSFLLGRRGFLHLRQVASTTPERLVAWFEEVLDAALSGGLVVHSDGTATLRTRGGPIALG
jgi:hypothetical protein